MLQIDYNPLMTGVNLAALSASTDSSSIAVNGADAVSFEFNHVNTSGALTITCYLETRKMGESTWRRQPMKVLAGANMDLPDLTISRVVAGTESWTLFVSELNADHVRLASITAAGAAATDTITLRARVQLRSV